jgi:hypothetical protein
MIVIIARDFFYMMDDYVTYVCDYVIETNFLLPLEDIMV